MAMPVLLSGKLDVEELRQRFGRGGMKTASLREQVVIMADKKEQTVRVDSLPVPLHFDRD